MNVKIFADGADLETIRELCKDPRIKGFTTNPSLMRKAGIRDYEWFAKSVIEIIGDRPVSFEVFSDDNSIGGGMYTQAMKIAGWGDNVYVKIPVTNTRREESYDLITMLSHQNVKVNVTALMTMKQVRYAAQALRDGAPSYISLFAGRIADLGKDPVPEVRLAMSIIVNLSPSTELIWASPREVLNVYQADEVGCHIITVTNDIFKKLSLLGKTLEDYSLETVKMFHDDAKASRYTL